MIGRRLLPWLIALTLAGCAGEGAPAGSGAIEQRWQGHRPPAELVTAFDGLGDGFSGPQGSAALRNPSDNSLAVGPRHVVQTVNSRMAIFTKTGVPLYGPVETRNVFRGFGGPCEAINNGDAVVRYDQLAGRWLVVMPIFRRLPRRPDEPPVPTSADGPVLSTAGRPDQPGPAVRLFEPPPGDDGGERRTRPPRGDGSFAMCYAVSTGDDPFGPYWRYEFVRPLFPDYPRPAVWPDGYYVPTSTGDDVIEKHACVVERDKMLRGEPAREVCFILDDVGFLNNADLDGSETPPPGAPNPMMATGGSQLNGVFVDSVLFAWNVHVDWADPARSWLDGPTRIPVAPYRYLCDGQLTECVPQPGSSRRLDSQGDKIMARLVYRRIGGTEHVVGVHSIATSRGTGGVRWVELRVDPDRQLRLHQQGTFAPDNLYRWMASPAIDRLGNIGIGYSTGGPGEYAGQRFAGRLADDSLGVLGLGESILVRGEAPQNGTLRWQDYTQTAIDPADDCTVWYVGDYLRAGEERYSTRFGAFRMPGCDPDDGPAGVETVSWLQGCWMMASGDRVVEEQWMAPRSGSMIGMSRSSAGGALRGFELVVIRSDSTGLAYLAEPSGQSPTVFRAVEANDRRVVFENDEHDFPQRIGYERSGPDSLGAWIEGRANGAMRRIPFPYARTSCPGARP